MTNYRFECSIWSNGSGSVSKYNARTRTPVAEGKKSSRGSSSSTSSSSLIDQSRDIKSLINKHIMSWFVAISVSLIISRGKSTEVGR